MKPNPEIIKFMSPFPYTVEIGEPLARAKELMHSHGIRHLPVTDEGKLVGLVTERDMLIADQLIQKHGMQNRSVKEILQSDIYVVESNEKLAIVLAHMVRNHKEFALIVKKGRLVGIFTHSDACKLLLEQLTHMKFDPGPPDIPA